MDIPKSKQVMNKWTDLPIGLETKTGSSIILVLRCRDSTIEANLNDAGIKTKSWRDDRKEELNF